MTESSRRITAVLFDLDNTLADRDRAFLEWARWFVQARLDLKHPDEITKAVAELGALDGGGRTPKDQLFSSVKERHPSLTDEVSDLVTAFRQQLLAHLPPLEQGASRLLDTLDTAGIRWGIVTNGSASQVRKVEQLGLVNRATCIVVSEEVGLRKPDPAIFQAAAARLGVAPSSILFVGDHPEADVIGAAQVGMPTAWVRRGREWPMHLPAIPDICVDSLGELLWIVESGNGQKLPSSR